MIARIFRRTSANASKIGILSHVISISHNLCVHLFIVYTRAVTSSSGEPISVQHLDSMNDVHSQSTKTSHDDAVAKQLSLRLSLKTSSSVVLNLTRSQLIDDQTPVYVANHSNVTRWTSVPVNQVLRTCNFFTGSLTASLYLFKECVSTSLLLSLYLRICSRKLWNRLQFAGMESRFHVPRT